MRILEFIAVSKKLGKLSGRTVLLVGPPGVGKTSIAKSIATCLDRKFAKISLGGENDVSVIKGHRKFGNILRKNLFGLLSWKNNLGFKNSAV